MKRQFLIILLKYGLGIGVLAWLIWSNWHIEKDGQEEGLAAILDKPFQTTFFLLAMGICIVSVLLTFVRWYFLVLAQELPFRLSSAIRLGFIGFFMSTFLPGSVGGDIIKAAFLAREQSRRTVAVATVLVDRLVGLCGLFWITALLGCCFWVTGSLPEIAPSESAVLLLETIIWGTGILASASLVVWLFMGVLPLSWIASIGHWLSRCPKIGGMLHELWNAVWMYRRKSKAVGGCLVLSMISHLGFFMTFYCAARAVSPPAEMPTLRAHLLIVPVGATIQAGFPAPGGMGGGEFGFGLLYEAMGYHRANGVWGSLMQRSIFWMLGLLGYFVYLRMRAVTPVPGPYETDPTPSALSQQPGPDSPPA